MIDGGNSCIKWLIFIFNFMFFLTGCGSVVFGIWLNVDQDDWDGIPDDYISVANVAIAAGVIIVFVAFLKCYGAITENKLMILGFFIVLSIIFILEIAAGIATCVMRGDIEGKLRKQLDDRIPERYNEPRIKKTMDAIQEHFECCGMDSISDWASVDIPMSCCISTASVCGKANFNATTDRSEYFQEGCFDAIEKFLEHNLLYVGITGIIFAIFQMIDMVFAMILYSAISKESKAVF